MLSAAANGRKEKRKAPRKQSSRQKRPRSVTPMRPVAIAPKTNCLNQGIIIKSEPNFIALTSGMSQLVPANCSNTLAHDFDRYSDCSKVSDITANPGSIKRMKLSTKINATQYILVQSKNFDASNTVAAAQINDKIPWQSSQGPLQETPFVKGIANDVNSAAMISLVDHNDSSVSTVAVSNGADRIPTMVNLKTSDTNANSLATQNCTTTDMFSLNKELRILVPKLDLTASATSVASKTTLSFQKSKSLKPVVIMEQLLSPARKPNVKYKQSFPQGSKRLVPPNAQGIKFERQVVSTTSHTSPSKTNEIIIDESKITHSDASNPYETKDEFFLKTEEFPAISSSQIDSVLKAINKELVSSESTSDAKKTYDHGEMNDPHLQLDSGRDAADKGAKLEHLHYTDIAVNAPYRLKLSDQPENEKMETSELLLEKHIDDLQYYKCKKCPYMCLNNKQMVDHVAKNHSSVVLQNEQPILKCPGCTNTFHSRTSLLSHIVHDHQVHQSEAEIMIQKLCQEESPIDENIDPKLFSRAVQLAKIESGNKECKQITTDATATDFQCNVESITRSNSHYAGGMSNASPGNAQTLDNDLMIHNEVQYLQSVDNIPMIMSSNTEAEKLDGIQFNDDNFPTESASHLTNAKYPKLKNTSSAINANLSESMKYSERSTKLSNCNEESQPEEKSSLRGGQPQNCTVLDTTLSIENTFVGELCENEAKPRSKSAKPKRKGRPKGCRTESRKRSSTELKQLGYKCSVETCGIRMLAQENAVYHQKCHAPMEDKNKINYQCPECLEFKSDNWNNIAGHLWRSHIIDMELHACDQCSYKTPSLSNLINQHRGIHGHDRPHLCNDCGKGFKTTKQLRNHRALHRAKDKQPLQCDKCQRVFTNARLLNLHTNSVHKDCRPFKCNYCVYMASTRSALKLHLRRHTGEKPFSCEQCSYSTGDHNSLRRHKLRHLGLKPYNCPHCSYACIQSSTYKVHLKNKHPGLDHGLMFSCQYCSYKSVKKENLFTHMAKHEQQSSRSQRDALATDNGKI